MDWGCAVGLKFRENGEEIYLVCLVAMSIGYDRNKKKTKNIPRQKIPPPTTNTQHSSKLKISTVATSLLCYAPGIDII